MEKKIKVKLIRGLAGKAKKQIRIIHALGIRKINQEKEHQATASVYGMINKVSHLVQVSEGENGKYFKP